MKTREMLFDLANSYLLGEKRFNEVAAEAGLKKTESFLSLHGLKMEYDELEVDSEGVTTEDNERINSMIYQWVDDTILAEKTRNTYSATYRTSNGTEPIKAFTFTNKNKAISVIREIGISETPLGGYVKITVWNDEDGERFEKTINVK